MQSIRPQKPFQSSLPCIRLPRVKFELTNQDSASGKNNTVLNSMYKAGAYYKKPANEDGTNVVVNTFDEAIIAATPIITH